MCEGSTNVECNGEANWALDPCGLPYGDRVEILVCDAHLQERIDSI